MIRLARRFDSLPFRVGELASDERPVMRGILVGVSLDNVDAFNEDDEGGSLDPCWARAPTLGEPAIVGRPLRELRRDASDCFCMELNV